MALLEDLEDKNKQPYTAKGLILSFLLGAATAVVLWFLFFRH